MKKIALFLISTLLVLGSITSLQAQRKKLQQYDLSLGVGLFPTFFKDEGRQLAPPLALVASYRLAPNISAGLILGYSSTETSQTIHGELQPTRLRNNFSVAGLRFAAHTTRFENWDIYGGLALAYMRSQIDILQGDAEKWKQQNGIREKSGRMIMTAFLGSRFKVGDHLGAFAELGFGVSLLQAGISYRF